MGEQDYDTVRADAEQVEAARKVKTEYDDTWAEVFEFYAERRPGAGRPRKWTEEEIREIARSSIQRRGED